MQDVSSVASLARVAQSQTSPELIVPALSGDAGQAVPAPTSARRPPWKSWPLIATTGALGSLMLGIIIIITTRNGRVTIDTGRDNATIAIQHLADKSIGVSVDAGPGGDLQSSKPPGDSPATKPSGPSSNSPSHPEPTKGESIPSIVNRPPAPNEAAGFTNSVGMRLTLIPAGEFMMGSPDANASPEELPEHKVRISTPFFLGVTEVTQGQYQAVIGKNPSFFSPTGEGKDVIIGQPTGEYPVEQVSWLDAIAFCNALSQKEGLPPYYLVNGEEVKISDRKGTGYRLPTEAEWEYACRAGKSGKFPPGDSMVEYGWFQLIQQRQYSSRWEEASQTHLGCTTCLQTSSNGVWTNLHLISIAFTRG